MINKVSACCMALASLALASCTLSEPDSADGAASDVRLSALSSYGMTMVTVSYDKLDRITEINYAGESIYRLTYSDGSDRPTSIVNEDYDLYYNDDTEKDERKISDLSVWTDIVYNPDGTIAAHNDRDTEYYYDGIDGADETRVTTGRTSYAYANGRLTRETSVTADPHTSRETTSVRNFTWENGLMTRWADASNEDHREWAEYEYSDVDNVNLQWDPNMQIFGPLAITGLFGTAPEKFLKSEKIYRYQTVDEFNQYAYALLPNGLINLSKMLGYDNESIVFNFIYEKK